VDEEVNRDKTGEAVRVARARQRQADGFAVVLSKRLLRKAG